MKKLIASFVSLLVGVVSMAIALLLGAEDVYIAFTIAFCMTYVDMRVDK